MPAQSFLQDPTRLPPCRIRVLMVLDGIVSNFGDLPFGVGELVKALSIASPTTEIQITKAHRRLDPLADISGFRFNNFDLTTVDQVWLLGVDRGGINNPLSLEENELRVLAEFMDDGGGVFSTGDHEDLGRAMSGDVPRVKSMRKWAWPDDEGPNARLAPPQFGRERHDTLRPGLDNHFDFNDQSDDIPQNITPIFYRGGLQDTGLNEFLPHPLLDSSAGVIRVMPDHMHEGECIVPEDLEQTFSFAGYENDEYPKLENGQRLKPEVIAKNTVLSHRLLTMDEKDMGPVNPKVFGSIGAYDGHRAGVGRVVVDATWHHFFNINLVGIDGDPDYNGFFDSPEGLAAYAQIKTYFRNIVLWLARPNTIQCQQARDLWNLRWHYDMVTEIDPKGLPENLQDIDDELWQVLGSKARQILDRQTSPCCRRLLSMALFRSAFPATYRALQGVLDPWSPEPHSLASPTVHEHLNQLLDASLAGALLALAKAFPDIDDDAKTKAVADQANPVNWSTLLNPGIRAGTSKIADLAESTAKELAGLGTALRP